MIAVAAFAASSSWAQIRANPRYVIQGDTVYDKKTDLTWSRCSIGQKWVQGTGCVGLIKRFTFKEAQLLASGNWRVPTKDELITLIDQTDKTDKLKPTIDAVAFPDMDPTNLVYWTSTAEDTAVAWDVHFDDGDVHKNYFPGHPHAVRLVRRGQ